MRGSSRSPAAHCSGLALTGSGCYRNISIYRFGSVRDQQISAQALGVDPLKYKVLAFTISSFYAGIAGGLFAGTLRFVGPESFDLHQMILLLVAVVLGGTASIAGSVIGGVMIV